MVLKLETSGHHNDESARDLLASTSRDGGRTETFRFKTQKALRRVKVGCAVKAWLAISSIRESSSRRNPYRSTAEPSDQAVAYQLLF